MEEMHRIILEYRARNLRPYHKAREGEKGSEEGVCGAAGGI